MGDQVTSCDMQRGSESCAANLQRSSYKNYLDCSSYRCRWRCSHGVSAVCCMYRDERVIFCGECSVLVFFFSPPLMYRLEVCLVYLYMLRLRVGVRMKTERQSYRLGEQANECLKQKQGEEGWKEGQGGPEGGRGENVSMHCGGWTGPEAHAPVQLL